MIAACQLRDARAGCGMRIAFRDSNRARPSWGYASPAAALPHRNSAAQPNERKKERAVKLYLAAPLFTDAERAFNVTLAEALTAAGHDVYLLQRDTPTTDSHRIFGRSLSALQRDLRERPGVVAPARPEDRGDEAFDAEPRGVARRGRASRSPMARRHGVIR